MTIGAERYERNVIDKQERERHSGKQLLCERMSLHLHLCRGEIEQSGESRETTLLTPYDRHYSLTHSHQLSGTACHAVTHLK